MTPETLQEQACALRRVCITGVFDMENYGDLLFPLIARHRLAPHGIEVVPAAPTAAPAAFPDAIAPLAMAEVMRGGGDFDGMVIGGGYLIHSHPMDFLGGYPLEGGGAWAAASLWVGTTLAAALQDLPVVWNAPGVLYPFAARQMPVVEAALAAADYVSVRDRGSASLLPPEGEIAVVPDPIAELARMWPRESLAGSHSAFLARKGLPASARLLAVHVRNRSLSGFGLDALAAALDSFAGREDLTPVLVAVGRSHDDPAVASELSAHLRVPHVVMDDPLSLAEITAVLAHASLYLGASLHGYIASAAYGVPGVLVARPAYHKFSGFLEHSGRPQDLARNWPAAFEVAARRAKEGRVERIPPGVFLALDRHWAQILDGLRRPAARRAERQAFLAALLRSGLDSGGPGWALGPFLSKTASYRRAGEDQTAKESGAGPR